MRLKNFSERGFLRISVGGAGGRTGEIVPWFKTGERVGGGEADLMRSKKLDERTPYRASSGGMTRGGGEYIGERARESVEEKIGGLRTKETTEREELETRGPRGKRSGWKGSDRK
jgi:hypothetical protein